MSAARPNIDAILSTALADPFLKDIYPEIRANRRYLHQHPEQSFKEFETSKWIAQQLESFGGISVKRNVGRTGVVGVIVGGAGPGPCVGLRADMDALPVMEGKSELNTEYRSQNEGTMHACGHDGHMSILLGVGKALAQHRHLLRGKVKLIFQPAEEGGNGALAMVEDGVLTEEPAVDEIYGLHLISVMPVGVVGVKDGPLMAASDKFTIRVKGEGGHGAMPHGARDPLVAAAALVGSLQTIVSRNLHPCEPGCVTVGSLHGGTAYNVIPATATMTGTVRSFSAPTRELIPERMEEVCEGISRAYKVKATLEYEKGYSATVNTSKEHVQKLREAALPAVGGDASYINDPQPPTMGAEDFSEYLMRIPGCFFFVGSSPCPQGTPDEAVELADYQHHSATFDIDERSLVIGAKVFMNLVMAVLGPSLAKSKL